MANIGIFATPDSAEALQKYMDLFCTDDERKAADLGYQNYTDILMKGQEFVVELLAANGLDLGVTIVLVTIAGMRWNMLDAQEDNAVHTERQD